MRRAAEARQEATAGAFVAGGLAGAEGESSGGGPSRDSGDSAGRASGGTVASEWSGGSAVSESAEDAAGEPGGGDVVAEPAGDAAGGPGGGDVVAEPVGGRVVGGSSADAAGEPPGDGEAAAGPAYPEEGGDWAWETRWDEEERRSREHDSDETQVIVAPVDDLPDFVPGFGRYDDPPAGGDEEDTVYVRLGAAETTFLTPGVRPRPSPSAGEPTADLGEEPTAFLAVPGEAAGAVGRGADVEEEPTTYLAVPGEAAGSVAQGADVDEEPTTFLAVPGEPVGSGGRGAGVEEEPTTFLTGSEELTTSVITRGADVGEEPTVVHGPGPDAAVVIDEGDEDRTRVVPLPGGMDEPTVPRVGSGEDEPTVEGPRPGGSKRT